MKIKNQFILLLILIFLQSTAQDAYVVNCKFSKFPNSHYELRGYEGLQQITLSTAESKNDGKFMLTYPKQYKGVAQLWMNGAYQTLLFLNQENINIEWNDLMNRDDLKSSSKEYSTFLKGMKIFQDSEAKLAGLNYLIPLYSNDSLKQKIFIGELDIVTNEFSKYVKKLPDNLFVRHYLLVKGLIEQMPKTVETYKWRAPIHIEEFMTIDFKMLKNSGLYKDIINGYTHLVERFPIEEISPLLNQAIDKVFHELKDESTLKQELAQYWFTLLEQKSLFKSAEYLALKILNEDNCMLSEYIKDMFEQYRSLAIGKTASNIDFTFLNTTQDAVNSLTVSRDLKGLKNNYKLIVFGASWCHNCQNDYNSLIEKYKKIREKNDLEIVYVSVDNDKDAFEKFYKTAPFITVFDGKGWETKAAKDYHVFATPTYILMDKNLKILAKIQSPDHLEQWFKVK